MKQRTARMPARAKKLNNKVVTLKRILVRESCTFSEPVATSSPNVEKKDTNPSGFINLAPLDRTLEMLCEKEIKEEQFIKEAFQEELKRRCELLLLSVDADAVYYTSVDHYIKTEKNKVKNKRLRDDDILMPPPSTIKRRVKKLSEKPRNDLEEVKVQQIRTRSSARLNAAQTVNSSGSSNQHNEAIYDDNRTDFKTPAMKGFLRRNRNIAIVTPGPNVNAPQTILRRPNPGETAISLSGSPLLVSSEQTSCVPQITIPLHDGRIMAVLAKDGLNPEDFPTMDSQTLSKLKMLHDFLGKL